MSTKRGTNQQFMSLTDVFQAISRGGLVKSFGPGAVCLNKPMNSRMRISVDSDIESGRKLLRNPQL